MKTIIAMLLAVSCSYAFSANWFVLQNSEPPNAGPYRFWGFIQPQWVHDESGAVAPNALGGAAGAKAYNSQIPVFNLVGPDLKHSDQFQILRARPGIRGVFPGTGGKINYFLLADLGNNALTHNGNYKRDFVLTDATISFNYIRGARIRVGLGRLPLGEEAMTGVATLDYNAFTNVTDGLLNERFVAPYTGGNTSPILGAPLKASNLVGAAGGFRDTGIEVYDWFRQGKWEYAYGLMYSRADGVNFDTTNNPGNHDVSGRLQAAYVFGGAGPKREDFVAYVWDQEGKRNYAGADYSRVRRGIGAKYERNGLRLGGEYIEGRGMIWNGPNPSFNQVAGGFAPVQLMALDSGNKANGYYLDAGWKFHPKFEADLRYDYYDRMSNSAYDERKFRNWTAGAQYFYDKSLRIAANYLIRNAELNSGAWTTAAQHQQLINGSNVLSAMGNVFSLMVTYVF